MKKILFPLLSLLAGLFVILVAYGIFSYEPGVLVFQNQSSYDIDKITVAICRQKYELASLPKSQSRRLDFKIWFDSGYDITVFFESGKVLHKEIGYVTNGMATSDVVSIKDNDINIIAHEVN